MSHSGSLPVQQFAPPASEQERRINKAIKGDRLMGPLKRCSICRQWKPRTSFARDASRNDGRCLRCPSCQSARWATWKARKGAA